MLAYVHPHYHPDDHSDYHNQCDNHSDNLSDSHSDYHPDYYCDEERISGGVFRVDDFRPKSSTSNPPPQILHRNPSPLGQILHLKSSIPNPAPKSSTPNPLPLGGVEDFGWNATTRKSWACWLRTLRIQHTGKKKNAKENAGIPPSKTFSLP